MNRYQMNKNKVLRAILRVRKFIDRLYHLIQTCTVFKNDINQGRWIIMKYGRLYQKNKSSLYEYLDSPIA